ncbi:MAG: ABC transporter permease [Pseudomonadota bacterium]
MTWLRLAVSNLGLSPLTTIVNILLMALGTGSIVLLLLAGAQLSDTLSRDARGIDLVLGAKGSPVQLVLSSVYHADVPPGNIPLSAAERWANDARVARAIPLSLGDSYRGFRIVGTRADILEHYGAEFADGGSWSHSMQAVVGAAVADAAGLKVGSRFAGVHGLGVGGHTHESEPYRVTGVLAATGSVVDRLILTSLDSVWDLHADAQTAPHSEHGHHDDDHQHGIESHAHDHHDHARRNGVIDASDIEHSDGDREITAMLLSYRSPMAAVSLPRLINADPALQAAAPAVEVSRILLLIGVGLDGLELFGWVLIATAGLSVFAALYGSLHARRRDLATLRCLGATRAELLLCTLLEGLLLSVIGVAIGFLIGHAAMELLGSWLQTARGVALTGWTWLPAETVLLLGLFAVGIVAAAIPAVQAYRTDPATTLAET